MSISREEIAALVKEARHAKGYTQSELAALAQLSLRTVQRIENAKVSPHAYTLKVLAVHLDFHVAPTGRHNTAAAVLPSATVPNRATRVIRSAGGAVIAMLCSLAYLSQSSSFPETTFEALLFWASVTTLYAIVLLRIWRTA